MVYNYCKNDSHCRSELGKVSSINVQHNALAKHAKTKAHKDAKKLYSGKKDTIEDGMNRCRATVDEALTNLFGGAYVIAKHNLSFNTYRVVLELLNFYNLPSLRIFIMVIKLAKPL